MDIEAFRNCTCFNLRKAARAVTQMYDEALKPTGLRATQVSVLAMVVGEGPLTMTGLANQLVMDRTTLTRNLKPLMADGLVSTVSGPDKRQRLVQITDRGRQRFDEAKPQWSEVQNRLADALGYGRWTGLLGHLDIAIEAAQARDDDLS